MNHAVSDKVHWFSIVNSVLIVLFLAFMVAMILVRALNRDITTYNRVRPLPSLTPVTRSLVTCLPCLGVDGRGEGGRA